MFLAGIFRNWRAPYVYRQDIALYVLSNIEFQNSRDIDTIARKLLEKFGGQKLLCTHDFRNKIESLRKIKSLSPQAQSTLNKTLQALKEVYCEFQSDTIVGPSSQVMFQRNSVLKHIVSEAAYLSHLHAKDKLAIVTKSTSTFENSLFLLDTLTENQLKLYMKLLFLEYRYFSSYKSAQDMLLNSYFWLDLFENDKPKFLEYIDLFKAFGNKLFPAVMADPSIEMQSMISHLPYREDLFVRLVEKQGMSLQRLDPIARESEKVVLAAIKREHDELEFASETLKYKKSVLLQAIVSIKNRYPNQLKSQLFQLELLCEDQLVQYHRLLIEAERFHKINRNQDVELLTEISYLLKHLPANSLDITKCIDFLKLNKDFVSNIVRNNPHFFEKIARYIPYAEELALDVTLQRPCCISDFGPFFRNSDNFVLKVIPFCPEAFEYASDALRDDRDLSLKVVARKGYLLGFVSLRLREDRVLVSTAIQSYPGAFQYATDALKKDRKIASEAVQGCGYNIKYIHQDNPNRSEIVLKAVKKDPNLIWILGQLPDFSLNLTVDTPEELLSYFGNLRGHDTSYCRVENDEENILMKLSCVINGSCNLILRVKNDEKRPFFSEKDSKEGLEFLTANIAERVEVLELMNPKLLNDRVFMSNVMRKNSAATPYVGSKLRYDITFFPFTRLLFYLKKSFLSLLRARFFTNRQSI